eukprot:6077569-Alexandrium_andersonii.AAC.1
MDKPIFVPDALAPAVGVGEAEVATKQESSQSSGGSAEKPPSGGSAEAKPVKPEGGAPSTPAADAPLPTAEAPTAAAEATLPEGADLGFFRDRVGK